MPQKPRGGGRAAPSPGEACPTCVRPLPAGTGAAEWELEPGLSSNQTERPSLLPGDWLTPGIRFWGSNNRSAFAITMHTADVAEEKADLRKRKEIKKGDRRERRKNPNHSQQLRRLQRQGSDP